MGQGPVRRPTAWGAEPGWGPVLGRRQGPGQRAEEVGRLPLQAERLQAGAAEWALPELALPGRAAWPMESFWVREVRQERHLPAEEQRVVEQRAELRGQGPLAGERQE